MQVICESCLTGGKHVQQRRAGASERHGTREREREKSGDVGLVDLWVVIFRLLLYIYVGVHQYHK